MKQWISASSIRALKTAAQTAVGLIAGNAVVVSDVDWVMVASASAVAAILSFLMSIDGLPELKNQETTVEETVVTEEPAVIEEAEEAETATK